MVPGEGGVFGRSHEGRNHGSGENRAGTGLDQKSLRRRDHRIQSLAGLFKFGTVGFEIAQEIEPEFVQREVSQRDGIIEVFEVKDLLFQPLELAVAEEQVLMRSSIWAVSRRLSVCVAARSTRAMRASTRSL